MSTLKVNNLQVGQDSTATNNLTWFQPGSPDGTIRLGSGNAGSATTKFTFDKDGNLTCVGNINAASILAPIEGTLDDWIVHAGDTNTKFGFSANDTFQVQTGGSGRVTVTDSTTTVDNDLRVIKTSGPLLELNTNGNTADATLRLSEGATGTTNNGGGMYYSGADNKLYITCGANLTTKRITIQRDDGKVGVGIDAPTAKFEVQNGANIEVLRLKDTHFNKYLTIRGGGSPNRMVIDSYEGGGGGADIDFASNGSTKLRITSAGHIVTQSLTSYSFNNDSSNAKILEVTGDGTVGEYGAINISGNQNANNGNIGNLRFINRENSNSSSGNNAGSKQVAAIQAYIKTSDTNAGDDSGGILTFHTKGENAVSGEKLRIDETGRVLIGNVTDDIGDGTLQVYTADRKHPAIRTNSPNANGYTMLSDSYQSDESQVNIGISYSSSALVLSRCCKVSDAADNTYLSSQDTFSTRPCALRLTNDGAISFHTTETNATVATDSAVSLTEVFSIDRVGNIRQKITDRHMYFGANQALKIGVVSSDPVIDAVSGDLQLKNSDGTIAVVRGDHLQMYADIKMNNDKGISFVNADDTASGETVSSSVLDDYEEGSFTATLKGHTDPSNTSSTNANKTTTTTGYYVKVGRNVTVTMRWYNLQNNGANEMHNCQLQNIHGLPYVSGNLSTNWTASIGVQRGLYPRWSNSSVTSQAVYMYGYIDGNDDKVQLRCSQTSGPGTLYPTVHDSTTHMHMTFTISYETYA